MAHRRRPVGPQTAYDSKLGLSDLGHLRDMPHLPHPPGQTPLGAQPVLLRFSTKISQPSLQSGRLRDTGLANDSEEGSQRKTQRLFRRKALATFPGRKEGWRDSGCPVTLGPREDFSTENRSPSRPEWKGGRTAPAPHSCAHAHLLAIPDFACETNEPITCVGDFVT